MKILAIRGCNLASLAGEFEIDLARGPLAGAGVFAIVGNTGAGKSTLLDALCVALFDRTPRLTNHSTVKVGRGSEDRLLLGAQDVRTLLRRGAAQGWAEVDFESGDAQQYRARWSVRRARGQSDGTLQDEQLSLTALGGGERLGGTKTETLKAIHARLGLSFDQFRRSALLAQGEFAAFLRADGKDRSELLERMTGTQIYSRLSIAAHLRAVLAEQRLRDGRTAALAISVLDDAAARALHGELVAAREAAEEARVGHARAEARARWQAEAARRAGELAAARADHAAARDALAAAQADRAELMLRRRAEQLRPAWDDVERLERRLATASAEVAAATDAAAVATRRQGEIAERRAELAALHGPVRAARIAAGLVERVAIAPPAIAIPAGTGDDAAWIIAHAALAAEVAAWPELDARFAQHAELGDAIAGLGRALAEHSDGRGKLARARAQLATELRAGAQRVDEARRKAASYAQKRGLTLDAARRLEDEARNRVGEVERLVGIAAGAREAQAAQREIERQRAEVAASAADEAAERARLGEAQRVAQAVRAEQDRVVAELRRAAGYAHARAELVTGEPCPLCGATEHPWRDRGALDGVIAAAEDRLCATQAELDGIAAQGAQLVARERQRAAETQRLTQQHRAAVAAAATQLTAWRDRLGALGELLLVDDPASAAAEALAADRLALARSQLEAARATRSQTEAATKAAQDAQAEVQLSQVALDQLASRGSELDRRLAELDAAIGRLHGEQASKREQRAALARELAGSLARWRAALPDGAAGVTESGTASASDARSQAGRRVARSAQQAVGATPAGVAAELPPAPTAGLDGEVDAALALALVARLSEIAAPRRAATPPPSSPLAIVRLALVAVVEVFRERAERIAAADAALAGAASAIERDAREIDRDAAEHAVRRGDAEQRRDQLARERVAAALQLDTLRDAAGFTADELRRFLSGDPSRVDALSERLAALDRAVERRGAIVTERERQVAEHIAARPDSAAAEPSDDAAAEPSGDAAAGRGGAIGAGDRHAIDLAASAAAVVAAERRVAQLSATLAADAEARERRAAALAEVAAEETSAEVDRVLGEVIGSHDGKLFRSFAQSLTLDHLLAVANAHLEELAPRYQLERVPRHDLELQVIDRDLGNEIRSVQSLSGGESFLVSLALALGLSSMSAHDVRVRTLLIDEGFGTLDPATLDSALSVLDALQATGRQVGVISHVPALVERVGAHVRVVQRGGGRSEVIVA